MLIPVMIALAAWWPFDKGIHIILEWYDEEGNLLFKRGIYKPMTEREIANLIEEFN